MLRTILRAYILCSIILLSQAAIWPGATLGQSKIYRTDYDGGVFQEVIQRADLDGSNLEDVLTTRLDEPTSLELDLSSGKLYWSDAGEIGRSNLDGSGVEKAITFESGPIVTPVSSGVSVDETAGKLYWIQGGVIHRANLDGSEAEEVITDNVIESDGLEVDPAAGFLYVVAEDGELYRSNLDGTESELHIVPVADMEHLAASVPTSIEELPVNDRGYSLEAPYPNPFRDRATITVTLERSQHVNVHLYNALGQRVSTPHSGWLSAGTPHQLTVDAAGKSGGVYLYQIAGEDFRATGTVTLMK